MALFSKKQKDLPGRRRPQIDAERATDASLDERYSFRRNRTLTGSVSSQVASATEKNANLKSARVQTHDLLHRRRQLGSMLLLVLASAGVLYYLISQFIAGVVVQSADVPSTTIYQEAIQSYLAMQPAERLRFLLDVGHLNQYLQAKTPEVAAVRVEGAAGLGKTAFQLKMRQPVAGWNMYGQRRYVDATGVSFARNYYPAPSVQIVDDSGVQVQAGQTVASNRFLGFVGRVVGLANTQGYTVTQVAIPRGTTRQIDLRIDRVGYPVKLSVDRPASEQVEDMARAIAWFTAHGQTPQYLDVRVSGKGYYR